MDNIMAIPTVDLSSTKSEAARQLVSALEGPGFLYLKNVKGYDPGIRFAAGITRPRSYMHMHRC